jgi:7,8-dihydroneopterin aldolase/epimerase/oxygenase
MLSKNLYKGRNMRKLEVGIESLVVECILGCLPEERVKTRSIEVDLLMKYQVPVNVDDIGHVVNYLDIANTITNTLTLGSFPLLETAASAISSALFSTFASIDSLTVTVRKQGAVPHAAGAYVRLALERGDVS